MAGNAEWEEGVKSVFKDTARLWCWEGGYFRTILERQVQEGIDEYKRYLGETNPLQEYVDDVRSSLISQIPSAVAANDPGLTPSDRELHSLIPVCVQLANL